MGDTDIENINIEVWNKLVAINLTGAMLTTQMAVRLMRKILMDLMVLLY